jgi:NADH-quinone oxidoreductase subunit N
MYFDEPKETAPVQAPRDMRVVLSLNGLVLLLLGIFPQGLMGLCLTAIQHL